MLRSYGLCSSPHAVQLHWCCLAGGVSCSCRDRLGWTLPEAARQWIGWQHVVNPQLYSSELRQFMPQEQHLVDGFMYECSQRRWQDLPSHLVALMRLMMSFSLRKRKSLKLLRQMQLTCFRMIFGRPLKCIVVLLSFPRMCPLLSAAQGSPMSLGLVGSRRAIRRGPDPVK